MKSPWRLHIFVNDTLSSPSGRLFEVVKQKSYDQVLSTNYGTGFINLALFDRVSKRHHGHTSRKFRPIRRGVSKIT